MSVLGLLFSYSAAMAGYDQEQALNRTQFKAAERAYEHKQMARYRVLLAELEDYPLQPYLIFNDLRKRIHKVKSREVADFIERWPDSVLADRLRRSWLDLLARHGQWKAYLKFDRPSTNVTRQCRSIWALHKSGHTTKALSRVDSLWLSGKSQPKACDRVFKLWKDKGRLTSEKVWARIRLAMKKGNWRLAAYLKKSLNKRDRQWVDAWVQAYKRPDHVLRQKGLKKDTAMARQIIVYAVTRLGRRDTKKAVDVWEKAEKRYAFTDLDRGAVGRVMGVNFALDRDPEALKWFAHLPEQERDESALGWAVRVSMVLEDWQGALDWIERMPKSLRDEQRWRYWRGRVLEELGRTHEANKYFAGVSLNRSFYGFLAADRVGAKYEFEDEVLDVPESTRHYVENIPAVKRARELLALDRRTDARREWRTLHRTLDPPELRVAAKLAQEWGWHPRAILTVAKGKHFDDLKLRFPLAFEEPVTRYAEQRGLDPSWVFAVLRQESVFQPDVRSHAGAMGLMQLMPSTARAVAKKLKTRLRRTSELKKPELNIRFGTYYLNEVFGELDRNPMLATAAYNAGPHRVRRWLPEEGKIMAPDLWAELIPFKETRTYVRRVMSYAVIYDQRRKVKEPRRITDRMREVRSLDVINTPVTSAGGAPLG